MEKQNTNEIFYRKINDNLSDIIFVKLPKNKISPEERLVEFKNSLGIKVQSVALPKDYELFTLKTESQVMNWMENKIHNVYTAYHKIHNKFDVEDERVHWSNNKMQNQRFLETKNLYKCRE